MFHPLIKFDQAIVDKLVSLLSKESTQRANFSSISKVLMQRSYFGLIDNHINQMDLLKVIGSALQARQEDEAYNNIKPNQYVLKYFNKVR